jgi:tRNA (guanine-N7-)-methyltransferase
MLWLGRLIKDIPDGLLQAVTIQFPDPWFKKKHAKRRMVNAELVQTVVDKLASGGRVFVQTDIEFLADQMFELFRSDKRLREVSISENPFSVKTEREKAVEDKELPVYRALWEKAV